VPFGARIPVGYLVPRIGTLAVEKLLEVQRVDESQETPQTSNTPTIGGAHTSAQEAIHDSIAFLVAAWEQHSRHEFEAYSVEDTQVDWQGTRYVLGESGYYLPDSTRASWASGKYSQGKEELATGYEWVLNLPPVVPFLVLWVAGVALIGTSVLVLYWVGRLLVGLVAGSI
jgi:hypothetical protein